MRQPAVADRFYPGSAKALALAVQELLPTGPVSGKLKGLAVVSPHAGYVYSGALAAETLSAVVVPETVIILGPNHRGQGAPVSLSTTPWEMPLGTVPIDREITDLILKHSAQIRVDELAHKYEHSLEVQVPFLQKLQEHLNIVPLVLSHISYPLCEEVAKALAHAIQTSDKDVLIVASSDMNHYESRRKTDLKDNLALQCIERLNPYDLYHTVKNQRITMCGVIPVVIAMLAAIACGASKYHLVGHTDSGFVSGDTDQVVGYAGIVIS